MVLARAVTEVGATVLFLHALIRMPIADATAIMQFAPLAITAAAALFLGAPVGWRRWLATLAGLAGVMLIVRPGGTGANPAALLALAAVLFVAARDLLTQRIGAHVPSLVVASASALSVTIASLGFVPFETWRWPAPAALAALVGSGIGLLGGHYWMIVALRAGDIAVVAPFRYSIVLWAVAVGFVVWGEVPDLATWIGIATVTAAGLYTVLREQRLAGAASP
jgi:drug/metabolite transporter (DMT)-like permease